MEKRSKFCNKIPNNERFPVWEKSVTHGFCKNKTIPKGYWVWCDMRRRCNNTKRREYPDYGGRGIRVCSRWSKFENFLQDMGEKPDGMSLDRIDNDGDYCPENCRWATYKDQAVNRFRSCNIPDSIIVREFYGRGLDKKQ